MEQELARLLKLKRRDTLPKVLLCSSECSPLSKTGGLADVAGALPKSLKALGIETRVITPYHRVIKERFAEKVTHMCDFEIWLGWRKQYVGLERLELDGLVVYLIDNEYYFGDRIYRGGMPEGEQYCYFQRAILECLPLLDFAPDILHCNDWQTSLLPFLLKTQYSGRPQGGLKTVLTIHNIAFQGRFPFDFIQDMLGIDAYWNKSTALEHYGCANMLKCGCLFADRVNTVSPNYANEIRTPYFGEGLQDVLNYRGADVSGILNGIDTQQFDPAADPMLAFRYDGDAEEFKKKNKSALLAELGLESGPDTPLMAMVTRMTSQKGFDLVMEQMDAIMQRDVAFVLLGTGDSWYEDFMRGMENRWKGRLCAYLGYNEEIARRIYAAADLFLMPSAFEPCGLSQMIAMRYGALPIVHETGGLADTVIPYNKFTGEGNGFSFYDYSSAVMLSTVDYALSVFADAAVREKLIAQAMSEDFSFGPSALEYARLFISVLDSQDISLFHDPFDEESRFPLGAVRCGETVRIFLRSNCVAHPEDFAACELILGDNAYPMEITGGGFTYTLTAPEKPQVLWYSFRLFGDIDYGAGGVGSKVPFQLTVYDRSFTTPDWAQGAVMYQIFPDRWRSSGDSPQKGAEYHRSMGRTIELHKSWDEPPKWEGGKNGEDYYPNDFYGGNLKGITESLPELRELGVDILYLNPIFESDSNHRYNTADYLSIDPILGTDEDFQELCEKAKEYGIRIILDGVFSHTGDDSVYFDRRGVYGNGAYRHKDSPYYSWFDFRSYPNDYRCWWNFKSLPEVNEMDPAWQEFVICGENSVVKTWLKKGADGYRLDVADELPDEALELVRKSVKSCGDNLIVGEVWEDATTKISYSVRRRYALGMALDSVMNYPLRGALIDFALCRSTAFQLLDFLLGQKLNYPEPMYRCLMNLMGSHDTARLRTFLGSGNDGGDMSRAQQAAFALDEEQNKRGRRLQKLCAVLQFTLPGMPCIYYGDEEGMQGFRDPFCRAPYVHDPHELRSFYASLAAIRNQSEAMRKGEAAFFAPNEDLIALLRFTEDEAFLVAVNRSYSRQTLSVDALSFRGCSRALLAKVPELPDIIVPPMDSVIQQL